MAALKGHSITLQTYRNVSVLLPMPKPSPFGWRPSEFHYNKFQQLFQLWLRGYIVPRRAGASTIS